MKPTKLALMALLLSGAALFPLLVPNPYYIHLVATIGIYAILLFGLDIVVGYTGEVSLGHAGLFGIGCYVAGIVAVKLGLPLFLAIPAAIAVAAMFGALLAFPALRVTGPYLAMVTLAFGTIIQILINEMDFLTNGPQGLKVLKPLIAEHRLTASEFYYFVIAMLALSMLVVSRLLKSHIGRAFEALRGSAVASDCMGVSVYRYKVLAFIISAAFAGLAGALFTYSEEYISPNTYSFELTVLFLLAIILGGRKTRSGAVLGAAIIVLLPNLLSDLALFRSLTGVLTAVIAIFVGVSLARRRFTLAQAALPLAALAAFDVFAFTLEDIVEHRLTIFGLMILAVVYYLPDGIMGFLRSQAKQLFPRLARAPTVVAPSHGGDEARTWAAPDHAVSVSGHLLEARGVVMQFDGLKALNHVDLVVSKGAIHGLIGPNGSGKSTMMNVLTGIYTPTGGRLEFNGQAIAGRTPSDIAREGIARTFQNVQLFGEMTTTENVLVGLHHTFKSRLHDIVLRTRRYRCEEQEARARAEGILRFIGLSELANEEARNLPYGKQRLLEIGRALGLNPSLLLLDEPAAGLTAADIKDLIGMIRKIREHGITVILIEHHMDVVMSICDKVTVLDFGQKIAEGRSQEIQRDEKVIEAYLGSRVHTDRPAATAVAS